MIQFQHRPPVSFPSGSTQGGAGVDCSDPTGHFGEEGLGPSEPLPRDDGWLVLALVVAHCGAGGASGKLIISSEPRAATRTALPTI